MKKYVMLFLIMLLFPVINVYAMVCAGSKEKDAINVDETYNFTCSLNEGETFGESFTYTHNNKDYSKHFSISDKTDKSVTINIIDKSISFGSEFKNGIIVISDGKNSTYVYFVNKEYKEPTEDDTTTSTTTTKSNEITYKVILDQNDGSEKTEKTCTVKKEGDVCYVTLPKLDKDNFNGWGTAKTCKEGIFGSTKINNNITYYACYKTTEVETPDVDEPTETQMYLKGLKIFDDKENEIEYGTFSIKKTNYDFKVLNDVESLKIETDVDENIKVEVSGNENLVEGENNILVKLIDENNNIKEYKLVVTKLKEGETLSEVHYLSALVIGNINLEFNKEKFIYNIIIPSDYDKLVINPIPEKEEDEVEIVGNSELIDGSSISINVTGKDKKTTTYTLNVTKEISNNNIILLAAIGVITLLIIILVILIIIRKNKNKKQIKKTTSNKAGNKIETLDI